MTRPVFQLRFRDEADKAEWEAAAKAAGEDMSAFVRRCVADEIALVRSKADDAEQRLSMTHAAFPQIPGVVLGSQVKGPDPKVKKYPRG